MATGHDFDLSGAESHTGLTTVSFDCANKTSLSELRQKVGENPSNPGVELGATGLISAEEIDRGECALAGPEPKRAPFPRACRSRGERAGGVGQQLV